MGRQDTKEVYTHGYGTAARRHLGRTVETHAAFFTPHLKPGMRVLDCGCGPGSITVGLADVVAPGETVGFDIGPSVIATANDLVGDRTNVRFEEASIYELPYPDSYYDALFINKVLEHEPETALMEVIRVLKPAGEGRPLPKLRGHRIAIRDNPKAYVTCPQERYHLLSRYSVQFRPGLDDLRSRRPVSE